MLRYKYYDYNQNSRVVINFEEQIQPETFEYTLHHLISNRLDLTPFDEWYTQSRWQLYAAVHNIEKLIPKKGGKEVNDGFISGFTFQLLLDVHGSD